ncbi:ATP/GTP-binding protein [Bacteroides sp. 224]|uniref:AAA family ATPase n=1 Tax=Bacteroides sp. 224 TaxID=2302936 RepID=UPI0013D15DD9|nr:ATP-binding protein [Bacteroides sp. 224]NDV64056.1 ATP-binding protein [Bacteroides sp. 224]
MIINFYVQNFGSIKDRQTLSFEADKSKHLEDYYVFQVNENLRLLKMALIYGSNASGKTMILRALQFLKELVLLPLEKKTEPLDFEPFLFDENTPHENTILGIEFIQARVRYEYEVEFNQKTIIKEELYNYNPHKANVFKRTTDIEKQFSQITFGGKIKGNSIFKKTLEANTLWNNTVIGGFLKTNIESKELTDVKNWFDNYLSPLIFPETNLENAATTVAGELNSVKNTIIQILKKADFNISDVLIKKEDADVELKFEHTIKGKQYLLPFEYESRGTKRYYMFALLLNALITLPVGIPIDEIDSSLHPDLFEHFLITFLLNSQQSQLIATTHNREILNNRDLFRNDAIWIVDRTEECSTELYSLVDFDTSVIRNTSNIYNAYKAGKFGGVPNLGDNYIEKESNEKG